MEAVVVTSRKDYDSSVRSVGKEKVVILAFENGDQLVHRPDGTEYVVPSCVFRKA